MSKRQIIILITILCLLYCTGAIADAYIGFESSDDRIVINPEENVFNLMYSMEVRYDTTKVSNLSVQFDSSENLMPESVTCVRYHHDANSHTIQEESIEILFTQQLENGLLDIRNITFGKGEYVFFLRCTVLDRASAVAYVKNHVLSHDVQILGQTEWDELSEPWCNTTTFVYLDPGETSAIVSALTFANDSSAKAGIPYELKANVVPETANVAWSVVDAGNTGAIVTDKVLGYSREVVG
ncbi:MAG: hypothetical protein IJ088_00565 [Clostridia bacterium]|nr:hypothetical protein [Clostridia bacterium]